MRYILLLLFITSCGYVDGNITSIRVEQHSHWGNRTAISANTDIPKAQDKTPEVAIATSLDPIEKCTHQNSQTEIAGFSVWHEGETGQTYYVRACVIREDGSFSPGLTRQFTAK